MDTHCPCQLCQPGKWGLNFLAGSHDKVGKLIHNEYQVGQVAVAMLRVQFSVDELNVILLDVPDLCIFQQFIAVIHLNAE